MLTSSCEAGGGIIGCNGVINYIAYVICGSKQGVSKLQVGQSQSFESSIP